MKIGWFLSVRQNSSRFPEKSTSVFHNGKTIPQFLYERIDSFIASKEANSSHLHVLKFVIPDDDLQAELEKSLSGYPVFKGHSSDLIKRNLDCSLRNSVDLVVRITCDDPFKDLDSIFNMVNLAIADNLDLVTNETPNSRWVVGTTAEVYSTQLLRYLYFNAWTSFQREHIEYANILKFKPFSDERFKIKYITDPSDVDRKLLSGDFSGYSLTVDTIDEFSVVQSFCNSLESNFTYDHIVNNLKYLESISLDQTLSTKSSHFVKLRLAQSTRSSNDTIVNINKLLSGDLRGSLTHDSVTELEEKFCSVFNVRYAIAMANGTLTLENCLRAVGVSPGDHVIVPNLTMAATALSVVSVGAVPIFADVDLDTYQICTESVKGLITRKTKALIAVSLFGGLPDLTQLKTLCDQHSISLIEDNAESLLSSFDDNIYSVVGDASSFSFQTTKHITSFEGGIVLTNNQNIALSLRRFSAVGYSTLSAEKTSVDKNSIQDPNFVRHLHVASNARLSPLSADIALSQLNNIDHLVNVRLYCSESYAYILKKYSGLCSVQSHIENSKSSFWGFPFVFDDDALWHKFRSIFIGYGGLPFYACWLPNSDEPAFSPTNDEIIKRLGKYAIDYTNIYQNLRLSNSRYLQKRMVILRTNLWDTSVVDLQCRILDQALSALT